MFTSGRGTRDAKCAICENFGVEGNGFSPGIRFTLYLSASALRPLPKQRLPDRGGHAKEENVVPGKTKCWCSDPARTFHTQAGFTGVTNLSVFPANLLRSLNFPSFQGRQTYALCIYWLQRAWRKGMTAKREKAPARTCTTREIKQRAKRGRPVWEAHGTTTGGHGQAGLGTQIPKSKAWVQIGAPAFRSWVAQ